eukprot:COSAG01_NODE_4790_length_4733_cov_15.070674_2_plen_53_part_00
MKYAAHVQVRVVGRAADFGVEYTKQRRVTVGAGDIVAWEYRERSQVCACVCV